MKIPLTDVIAHRHLLSPREAATLTLAVGREWDRKRARAGNCPLPDVTHIELTDGGAISFAESSADRPACGGATLSQLLGQLLGLDDQHAPQQPIPGGLLITMAGRLGPMDPPSFREDGFRSALLRFADEDPGAMAKVFTRIVAARDADVAQGRHSKTRRGPERRRQQPAVAALRRAVRELERQTFEAKVSSARTNRAGFARDVPVRRRTTDVLVAGAVALLLSATGFVIGAMRAPTPIPEEPVTEVRTPVQLARPSADTSISAMAPARKTTPPPRPASQPRLVRVPERKSPRNHLPTTFAGGSRAITWSQSTR